MIDGVTLLCEIEPKTDSSKWEPVETLETSFEKKEELVREMAKALFDEMIVSTVLSGILPGSCFCYGKDAGLTRLRFLCRNRLKRKRKSKE